MATVQCAASNRVSATGNWNSMFIPNVYPQLGLCTGNCALVSIIVGSLVDTGQCSAVWWSHFIETMMSLSHEESNFQTNVFLKVFFIRLAL